MTDRDLVEKKLARIVTHVEELRRLAHPEAIRSDIREERFVEHTLQLAIQATLDVASHVVSDQRLGEPRANRDLFELLARGGWIDEALAGVLVQVAGFRNVLVHGYEDVDLAIVEDVLRNHLDVLLAFVAAIQRRL